jgi:hypothetical protein
VVLGLHLVLLWLILATSRVITRRTDFAGLEIVLIAHPPASPEQPASPQEKSSGHVAQHAIPQPQASASRNPSRPAPPEEQDNAIHSRIDWVAELKSAARNATHDGSAKTPKDFGFPHLSSAPAQAPQFGWDYAATHRLESIPGGGLLVNLDDRCVLVMAPLPFIGCGIGEKQANGDLFKNMGDPQEARSGSAP